MVQGRRQSVSKQRRKSVRHKGLDAGYGSQFIPHILAIERQLGQRTGPKLNVSMRLFGIKLADFPVPIEGLFLKCKVSTFREHSFQLKAFVSPTIFPDQFGTDMIPCDIFPATKQSPHGVASDTKGLPTCMPHPGGEGWDLDWH